MLDSSGLIVFRISAQPSCLETEKRKMGNTLPIVPELWLCGGLATKRVTGDCRDGDRRGKSPILRRGFDDNGRS